MKKAYMKPMMVYGKEPTGIIPLAAAAVGLGLALGASSASAFAIGSAALAGGAAAAAGLGAAAGAAATKVSSKRVGSWECLPALDMVEVYT
jgi:hypothetical protein